jgi:ABC-2 type transport system ATP-binding protein
VSEAPPVELAGVSKRYGSVRAVDELSFVLAPGTVTGFLGPNGAGKTTTLRMIGGLVRPSSGAVRLFGRDAGDPSARTELGYMPADPAFLPHLSGVANLDLLGRLHRARSDDRDSVASALHLSRDDLGRHVGGYSSGMKQKLAIVAALQHHPRLVVLDEPANRLDPIAHRAFCDLVRAASEEGRTVLLSSHVLGEVDDVCDTVVLIREGRLLREAGIEELRQQSSRAVTLVYAEPPVTVPALVTRASVNGTRVTGRIPAGRPDIVRKIVSDPALVDITIASASLEDVFLDLYTAEAS